MLPSQPVTMASTQTRASSDDFAASTRRLLEVVMTIPMRRFGALNLLLWSMKTSEISGKKITPFGFFSFSLLKMKINKKEKSLELFFRIMCCRLLSQLKSDFSDENEKMNFFKKRGSLNSVLSDRSERTFFKQLIRSEELHEEIFQRLTVNFVFGQFPDDF